MRKLTSDGEMSVVPEVAKRTGLIIKGATALFLEGPDPGRDAAVALVNHHRMGNMRIWSERLSALDLTHISRPHPLQREHFSWAYVFVNPSEGVELRLEPGPFDDELTEIVKAIEKERTADATDRSE